MRMGRMNALSLETHAHRLLSVVVGEYHLVLGEAVDAGISVTHHRAREPADEAHSRSSSVW